jgi:hypothetical protein
MSTLWPTTRPINIKPTETKKVITEARKVKVVSPFDPHPMQTGTRTLAWQLNMWKS